MRGAGEIEIATEPPYAFEREVVSGELRVRERFEFRTLAELQEHVAKDKAEDKPGGGCPRCGGRARIVATDAPSVEWMQCFECRLQWREPPDPPWRKR